MYRTNSDDAESPGFARISYGSDALLVPEAIIHAIKEEKENARRAESELSKADACEPKDEEVKTSAIKVDSEPFLPATYSIEVFSEAAISGAIANSKRRDSDTQIRVKETITALQRRNGRRLIPDLESDVIETIVTKLRRRFPNFGIAIDHLETELSLAMASTPEAFRITPLLLHGSPGIGKTAFAMALAGMLGVGFDRVSAAGVQGAFELMGTSAHWANAGPGRVLTLLADNDYATPILLIDEVDKIGTDDRYPIGPALLELLEPVSSRDLMDESMALRFDASKIIIIMTANDITAISEPLLSRLHAIEISPPTAKERRSIAATIFQEMATGLITELEIQDDALDHLATAPIDIRAIGRLVRDAIGRAIRAGNNVVGIDDIRVPSLPIRSRAGFV